MENTIDFDRFVRAIRDLDLEETDSLVMAHSSRVSSADWQRIEDQIAAARQEESGAKEAVLA